MTIRLVASVSALMMLAACLGACSSAPGDASASGAQSAPSSAMSADTTASGDRMQSATNSQVAASKQTGATSAQIRTENSDISPINGDAWVQSAEPVTPKASDSPMVFHDLRVGEHDTFYRIVAEFSGNGTPGYFQAWADTPIEQGRGRRLPVEGTSFLNFMISGTSMPSTGELDALAYEGPSNLRVGPLDVREDGTFEDTTHIVIGMDSPRDFQIGFLSDPTRVVIDVKK